VIGYCPRFYLLVMYWDVLAETNRILIYMGKIQIYKPSFIDYIQYRTGRLPSKRKVLDPTTSRRILIDWYTVNVCLGCDISTGTTWFLWEHVTNGAIFWWKPSHENVPLRLTHSFQLSGYQVLTSLARLGTDAAMKKSPIIMAPSSTPRLEKEAAK
jgi:hypothetical protein